MAEEGDFWVAGKESVKIIFVQNLNLLIFFTAVLMHAVQSINRDVSYCPTLHFF